MMLSARDIQHAITQGELKVDPALRRLAAADLDRPAAGPALPQRRQGRR